MTSRMVKCARTVCQVEIDSVLGGGTHKHTGRRYCLGCARAINRACGEVVIVIPRFNVDAPNMQIIPREPRDPK